MKLKLIFGIVLSCIILADCVPVEYVYTGEGCECPTRLGYHINLPQRKPKTHAPCNQHGYKIEVPPMQTKAKVSYTFDFSVEEPRPPCPKKQQKLDLYAKVDRIALPKKDCLDSYAAPIPLSYAYEEPSPAYAAPPAAPCGCRNSRNHRYVNGKWIPNKCKCQNCKCHLRQSKTSIQKTNRVSAIVTPIVVASGSLASNKNSIRRKRDLSDLIFQTRRQHLARPSRYVKLYNKHIPTEEQKKQGWFDLDLFADNNPFNKRKTKKVFFPLTGSRIVKRDIKGEYDLLEKEREAADLTLPEIIQFMPETLQPDFKRGPCQFGCNKSCPHAKESTNLDEVEQTEQQSDSNKTKPTLVTEQSTVNIADGNNEQTVETIESVDNVDDEKNFIDSNSSFTKRNAAIYGYQPAAAAPKIMQPQNAYTAEMGAWQPSQIPTDPNYDSAARPQSQSPCEQRKIYAAMRRAAENAQKYVDEARAEAPQNYDRLGHKYIEDQGQLRLMVSTSSSVPDPIAIGGVPLQYAGDLEMPQIGYSLHSDANPMVGASRYPVQHIPSAVLDRIISDIVYRHPDFIDASSHYGGGLVDPEPYQDAQTKDFIKKLIDGRLSLMFGEPDDHYLHYYPEANYDSRSFNPYRQLDYYPTMY